jgi:hypothetical protein
MVLIGVHAQEAVFLELGKPRPMVLFEMAKSVLTGAPAELGRTEQVSGDELRATKPEAKGR